MLHRMGKPVMGGDDVGDTAAMPGTVRQSLDT
jgi:hypothetical protein